MLNTKRPAEVPVRPVRRIGVKTQHVRGKLVGGQEYESLLERDFLKILRFDPAVDTLLTQPLKISYEVQGAKRTYVPDALVTFKADSQGVVPKPVLYEVKPQEYAEHPDYNLAEKFSAATLYCDERSWVFKVVTEADISASRLEGVNFLSRYQGRLVHQGHRQLIRDQLARWNDCATIQALLTSIYRTPTAQAELLPDIWTLLAAHELGVDLDLPLTMTSEIWIAR